MPPVTSQSKHMRTICGRRPTAKAESELRHQSADPRLLDGPLLRPLRPNGKRQEKCCPMARTPSTAWCESSAHRGYSAHSMRATFITTALENGAQLEDVQKAAGHPDRGTTKLYDRRGYNPEKAESLFATC
jgi:integrase